MAQLGLEFLQGNEFVGRRLTPKDIDGQALEEVGHEANTPSCDRSCPLDNNAVGRLPASTVPLTPASPTPPASPTLSPPSATTTTPPATDTVVPSPTRLPTPTATATPIPLKSYALISAGNFGRLELVNSFETKIEDATYFSANDQYMVFGGGWNRVAEFWDNSGRQNLSRYPTDSYGLLAPNSNVLAVASPRNIEATIALEDLDGVRSPLSLGGFSHPIYEFSWTDMAFSPDGRYLAASIACAQAAGPENFPVLIWDTTTGKKVGQIAIPLMRVQHPAFSPDTKRLTYTYVTALRWDKPRVALVSFPGLTRLWDVELPRIPTIPTGLVFAPDGRTLTIVMRSFFLVLDAASGNVLQKINVVGGADCVLYFPDGQGFLGCVASGRAIQAFDLQTGEPGAALKGVLARGAQWIDSGRTLVLYAWSPDYSRIEVSWYRVKP